MKKKSNKKNKIKNLLSNQKGMALLTTLIFVFLLVTFGVALLTMTSNDIKLSALQRDSTKAFYVAEAGVEYARHLLGQSWDNWKDPGKFPITTKSFGSGTFDVEVTDNDDGDDNPTDDIDSKVVIKSTGIVGTTKRVIEVVVGEPTAHPIFEYAIAGRYLVKLENIETMVEGDVYCDGNIVNEEVTVGGTGIATGTVEIEGDGYFTGGTEEGADVIDFPTLNLNYYESNAVQIIYEDLIVADIDDYQVDGIIYVKGNVHFFNSTIIGPGIIVAEGWIKLENNSVCGTSKETVVGLFSNSENSTEEDSAIRIETELNIYGVIFAPQGNVKVETTSGVYGSVIGGAGTGISAVKIETGSGVFHYDVSSYIDLPPGDPVPTIVSWREM